MEKVIDILKKGSKMELHNFLIKIMGENKLYELSHEYGVCDGTCRCANRCLKIDKCLCLDDEELEKEVFTETLDKMLNDSYKNFLKHI